MNRVQLLDAIRDVFNDWADEGMDDETLRSRVIALVDDFCDEIVHETRQMKEILDRVI